MRYSAGTGGYHIGSPPDSRSARTCAKYGVATNHRARQVTEEDFKEFNYILAMDNSNLEDLQEIADAFDQRESSKLGKGLKSTWFLTELIVQLFGDYRDPNSKVDRIVRDPYYGYHRFRRMLKV